MKNIRNYFLSVLAAAILFGLAGSASAQRDGTPKKRLAVPATARGFIGGESHDSYVVRAVRGKTLSIEISWRKEGDNRAEFSVSRKSNFFSATPVNFGTEANDGKTWTGKIPRTGNYYIYVVANPSARYTLRVRYR